MRKKTALAISAMILCLLVLYVGAEEDNSDIIHDISPFGLENNIQKTLCTFNETNAGWDSDNTNTNVTLAENIDTFPYTPLTGDGCLIVRTQNAQSGQRNYISKSFDTPLDLSAYNSLIIALNCSEVENGKCVVTVEMYTDEDMFIASEEIKQACWNGFFADISAWESRNAVNRIRISVSYGSDGIPVSFFEYYIDSISVSAEANAVNSVRFSAEDYTVIGGSGTYTDGVLDITNAGDELQLDSVGFSYGSIGEANSIKVEFQVDGLCTGMGLYVQSEDGRFFAESYTSVSVSGGKTALCLPLSEEKIRNISIVFEGVKLDRIQIYSIEPASTYIGSDLSAGSIDTCALNTNTEEIIIKGSLDKDRYGEFEQKDIYLFANDLCDSITPESLSSTGSIAKSNITSEDFIFRVKYSDTDDERLFLYKKYTVAVKNDSGFEIIGGSKCITNPESFNQNAVSKTNSGSGKGVYGESISFMQEMGVSDTVVWIDIGKFFLQESAVGNKFECGGNLYYYNSEYFTSLDTMIKNYSEKDINVTLIFVVSDTGNETLNRLLIHKNANIDSTYCAYNTSDRAGLMYLRAIIEFFAERYCGELGVTRFVFGDSVAMSSVNYNMGDVSLAEFVSEYATGLRVVYNAVKSYSPYVGVYTYIDDNWDRGLPFDFYTRYDNKAFIDGLNSCISDMGNIGWGVAQNPYPRYIDDYFSYSDTELENSDTADRVSFKNIGVLSNYLTNEGLMYNSSERDFIIIEKTFYSNLDEQNITADYVYNCYKALNTAVSAYITDRNCNYNNAMKYIDTSLSLTASSFAPDVLGVATWESVIEGFSEANIVKRRITTSNIALNRSDVKGSIVISDFSSGNDGWTRYGFTERMASGSSLSDRDNLLSLFLGNVPAGETRGIVKKFDVSYDMSATPILHFGINVASLPTNVNYANITVIMTSGSDVYEVVGSIKEASWTEVYCDFSNFSGISRVDSIKILFHATENYYDSPQALITSVEGVSVEYDDEQLENILNPDGQDHQLLETVKKYAYPALASVIAVCLCIFIWRRTAKKRK